MKPKLSDSASADALARPFFSRELSWIDFNERVLEEASRAELPPLERLKFLCIVSSNFDEFFMVRIAALKRSLKAGPDASGLRPVEQLSLAAQRIRSIVKRQYAILNDELLPALEDKGLTLVRPGSYNAEQIEFLETLFHNEIFPTLTPLRIEEDTPFPFTGNLRLHAAFLLEAEGKDEKLAIARIPANLERIVWLPKESDGKARWTLLDDVVAHWGYSLFSPHRVKEATLFKVTRDADFGVDEERDADFIEAMEEVLLDREQSRPVRLSVSADSPRLRDELRIRLGLGEDDVYELPGPIDLRSLMEISGARNFNHLRENFWSSWWPRELPEGEPLWDAIRARDRLLHHPYDSFEPVVQFLRDAAADPDVIAIKITLYRTGGDSPIVEALETAAKNGKHVTALVELKARFDEGRNITWATRLVQAGAVVVYGIAQLKVHAKICMVLRKEMDGVRRYLHLATGNYNDRTAKLYSDIGLFTANPEIAKDASLFFNAITGYSSVQQCRHLIAAPMDLKRRLIELIDRETKRYDQGYPSLIMAKMNSLADIDIINALYRASNAGVTIRLNVRGICMLRPGVRGLSERIEVISILDHYLEHGRIFYFANGGSEEVFLSSADWMPRNLERRVELMIPLLDERTKIRAVTILKSYFDDDTNARLLKPDGTWKLRVPAAQPHRAQKYFNDAARSAAEAQILAPRQEFVVRRSPPNGND